MYVIPTQGEWYCFESEFNCGWHFVTYSEFPTQKTYGLMMSYLIALYMITTAPG